MSAPTTATVETLTAEVHVLKVGNRQITMSVAKQLDVVAFDRLNPFGRVRIENFGSFINVVGAHIETGALCRARMRSAEAEHAAAAALPLIVLAGLR